MMLIEYKNFSYNIKGSVITVGNFDGVHKAHAILLKELYNRSLEKKLNSIVITFEPHTKTVLYPEKNYKILTTLQEKALLIESFGIDFLVWIKFTKKFSQISYKEFIEDIIIKKFNAKEWILGDDHAFGKNKEGNKNVLQSAIAKNHIDCFFMSDITEKNKKVSSSNIRELILEGRIKEAREMLGHPYLIKGERITGKKRGTELGYPTINFRVSNKYKLLPPSGVYAGVLEYNNRQWIGARYLGKCPTFSEKDFRIEFYEINFSKEEPKEGDSANIWLYDYIREDISFSSKDKMVKKINEDINIIKNFFSGEKICL